MLPISMVLGMAILRKSRMLNRNGIILLFALSYAIWPVWDMKSMWNKGTAEYKLAQDLKQQGIKGNIASNVVFGMPEAVSMQRVAYFSGNSYYIMYKAPASFQELLPELRKYDVKYYCYYPQYNTNWQLKNEKGEALPSVDISAECKVFILNP